MPETVIVGLKAVGVSAATATAIAPTIVNLAVSVAVNFALTALAPKTTQKDVGRELSAPTNKPTYRYVYGHTRAVGTPIFFEVKNQYLYVCYLLNSRPSEGNFDLYLDKRLVDLVGDPEDFTLSGGGVGDNSPFDNGAIKIWYGLGDQTTVPAELLDDIPYSEGVNDSYLKSTDVGAGLTIAWVKYDAGDPGTRNERWPSSPPLLEIEGDFSKVYDPREESHDFNNPDTWEFSSNHALCVLDCLTQNPFRPYQESNLIMEQWISAADVSDTQTQKKDLSYENTYELHGTIAFTGNELSSIITPMFTSGAATPIRVGGRLGIKPGSWETPSYVAEHFISSISYSDLKSVKDLPTQVRVSYTSAERGYTSSDLKPYNLPDTEDDLESVIDIDLSLVSSPTQAMRVRKILGLRAREQIVITATLDPSAVKLIGGSNLSIDFEDPYSRFNGTYSVSTIAPGVEDLLGDSGCAMLCPVILESISEDTYAWDPETEEEEIILEVYNGARQGVRPPGTPTYSVSYQNNGGALIPRIIWEAEPSESTSATHYEWQYRADDEPWINGTNIDPTTLNVSGNLTNFIDNVDPTKLYDIRVKTVSGVSYSSWSLLEDAGVTFEITGAGATDGVGEVSFTGTTPSENFKGLRVYRNSVGGGFATSVLQSPTHVYPSGSAFSHTETGQAVGTYDYWLVPVSLTDQEGTATGPFTLTVT